MTRSVAYTSSPLLASKTPVWRSKFIVAMIALGFVVLAGRAAWVQVFANDFFQKQGEVRFARTLELPANRGRILDRNGLLLASSVPTPSIWAIPEDVERDRAKLGQLAKLLEMPLAELNKKLEDEDKTFVWLKRQVDEDAAKQIAALNIKGVYQRKEYKRQYPEGEAAAHVVGFTNVEDRGQEGMELAFQKDLAGRPGMRRVIKDRMGRVVEDVGEQVLPVPGRDLQLSIDSKVQFFAYQKLRDAVIENKAKAGSVVVLDATTGEVLALANYPSYTPGRRQNLTGEQLRNRAMTDVFEPGSTMKPFTIGLALETGLVTPQTPVQTAPGYVMMGGRKISDAHPHGVLSVQQVIQKSSNIGTLKLALQMPAKDMWELYTQAGFGQKPQITFPGAVTGRLRPYKTWKPVEQATMSYGYGLSASLFQMARSYTVFAHDGNIIPATLLKTGEPAAGVKVFSPKTAGEIRTMLQMAAGPGGTGQKAQTQGYSVGGKSGTAHKQVGKSYVSNKYRSWFVGIAPIDKPRIIVAVMVDEPSAGKYYGGDVAAPIFSTTVQQTLRMMGVQPDMNVKPQIVVQAVEESF
ncbi:penicillin-binding protein 2 [Ramlibacter sp. WS9]|uniref:peptidoglycan D,D-transpeptidase FtsI family protein n=1 Tax=Ramlibacter sp. WS9 TaxID=1882741 RepID=UPI001142602B|nr:penicillin-binding protein 2 [Ramlibacter sp. WS9]ROZ72645.1 penicillin-binding protein 2 [Ramlibacter sp. WS9]